jgi:cytochrome c
MKKSYGVAGTGVAYRLVGTLQMLLLLCSACARATELSDTQARAFFNDQGCNACHGVNETRLGPSFEVIARRYTNIAPEGIERLALKIRLGGAGAWGTVPMISYPGLSDEDTRRITRWILRLNASDSQ